MSDTVLVGRAHVAFFSSKSPNCLRKGLNVWTPLKDAESLLICKLVTSSDVQGEVSKHTILQKRSVAVHEKQLNQVITKEYASHRVQKTN